MVQKQMQFDGPFGTSELCPREQGEAKRYRGTVQGQKLIVETKPMLSGCGLLAGLQGLVEEIPEHLPRPMRIRVRERGFVGSLLHSQMTHLSHTTGQAPADFSQAFGLSQLAEEHGHEMIPGIVSLCVSLCPMLDDQPMKLSTLKQADQLTEETGTTYHDPSPPCCGFLVLHDVNCTHKEDFFN